jgi:hypothetical protein
MEDDTLDPITNLLIKVGALEESLASIPKMEDITKFVNDKINPILDSNRKLFAMQSEPVDKIEEPEGEKELIDIIVDQILDGAGIEEGA